MKSMETGRQDGGSDKNHAPFSVGKTGNISRKFLTIILKIFDKNFERLHEDNQGIVAGVWFDRLVVCAEFLQFLAISNRLCGSHFVTPFIEVGFLSDSTEMHGNPYISPRQDVTIL